MSSPSVAELRRQIAALRRARHFVHYRDSFALAERLRSLVAAIEDGVLPADPETARDLAERLLRADSRVFDRVDDSAGVVSDVFRDACRLWLRAAAASSTLGSNSRADRVGAAKRLEQARRMGGRVDWDLLARCYEQLGDTDRQIECLWQSFKQSCSATVFRGLETLVQPEEREALRERAVEVALTEPYVPSAVTCLLDLERAREAESLLLQRFPAMGSRDADYTHLLHAAERAAECGTPLTEALCYRRLLLDILEEARSRAYGHAARYLARLSVLDERIRDYRTVPDHAGFLELLRQHHGRKRAFWRRVDERRS